MRQQAHIIQMHRQRARPAPPVSFDRREFRALLSVYGRMVSNGEWRDYAMDFEADFAQFAVYSRSSDCPVYRIEKRPEQAKRQGAYALIGSDGRILLRSMEIERVLGWFDPDASKRAAIVPFRRNVHRLRERTP